MKCDLSEDDLRYKLFVKATRLQFFELYSSSWSFVTDRIPVLLTEQI